MKRCTPRLYWQPPPLLFIGDMQVWSICDDGMESPWLPIIWNWHYHLRKCHWCAFANGKSESQPSQTNLSGFKRYLHGSAKNSQYFLASPQHKLHSVEVEGPSSESLYLRWTFSLSSTQINATKIEIYLLMNTAHTSFLALKIWLMTILLLKTMLVQNMMPSTASGECQQILQVCVRTLLCCILNIGLILKQMVGD